MTPTICSHCGATIMSDSPECYRCGTPLSTSTVIALSTVDYEKAYKGILMGMRVMSDYQQKLESENHSLRHLLSYEHLCSKPIDAVDDYMKCDHATSHRPIDFIHDTVDDIREKLNERYMVKKSLKLLKVFQKLWNIERL